MLQYKIPAQSQVSEYLDSNPSLTAPPWAPWASSLTPLATSFLVCQLAQRSYSAELLEVIKGDNADVLHSKQKVFRNPRASLYHS